MCYKRRMTRASFLLPFVFSFFMLPAMAQDAPQPAPPPVLTDIMSSAVVAKTEGTTLSPELPAALPQAAEAPIPPLDPASFPVLGKIKEKSGDVHYDYLGQRSGLDAWIVSGPGLMQIIYTLPNNQGAIIGGNLVDAEGKDIATPMQQDFIAKNPQRAQEMVVAVQNAQKKTDAPDATASHADVTGGTMSQKIWDALEKTGWVSFGSDVKAPALYAILDPYQPQSRDMWKLLEPMAALNKIRLYVIPLATVKPEAVESIARLLGDADRSGAWNKLVHGEELPKTTGPQNPQGVLDLKNNLDFMQTLNLRAVPVLLYHKHNTGVVRILRGMPKDWMAFEAELLGDTTPALATPEPTPEAAPLPKP